MARIVRNKWYRLDKVTPKKGQTILCAVLERYQNAPWEWTTYQVIYPHFGRYVTPEMWMLPKLPPIPMNSAHKRAKKTAKRENYLWKKREELERKLAMLTR